MNIYNVCNKREEDYEKEVRPCDGGCADGFILSSLWWFFVECNDGSSYYCGSDDGCGN